MICLLMYLIQKENCNCIFAKRLLITGIFFYLIPVQSIKYLIPEEIYPKIFFNIEAQSYISSSLSYRNEGRGEYLWIPQWITVISKLWLLGIVIFTLYEVINYWKGTRSVRNFIYAKVEDKENNFIYYLIPDDTYGPCTIGFFRQKIIVPESFPLHPDFAMVYKHERAHLKNHDNLMKLLCLLVLCLHWMNPVVYLLLFLYIDTAEIVSDNLATEDYSKQKRKDYAKLLVLEASTSDVRPVVWRNNLSGDKFTSKRSAKILKRRIDYMMKEKKKGWLQKWIMAAVSALTLVTGAGTVLAYEPAQWSDDSFTDVFQDDSFDVLGYNSSDFENMDSLDFSESDYLFVDVDGTSTACDESISSRILCTHSMVNGKFYAHAPNSSGGCTVKVYTCQRCKKCGYLANKKYSNTITFAKCPH